MDKDEYNKDTENIDKMDLPGACRREEKGPVKPNPHLLQYLEAWFGICFAYARIILAHSGSR